MGQIIRQGDLTSLGNKVLKGAKTVLVNQSPVAIQGSIISNVTKALMGSSTVFVEGVPVIRTGGSITGKLEKFIRGSSDVNCG